MYLQAVMIFKIFIDIEKLQSCMIWGIRKIQKKICFINFKIISYSFKNRKPLVFETYHLRFLQFAWKFYIYCELFDS